MSGDSSRARVRSARSTVPWRAVLVAVAVLTLVTAACGRTDNTSAPSALPSPTPDLALLTTTPEVGPVGTSITVTGTGLPSGKTAELLWATVDGTYDTKLDNNRVEFYERVFTEKRVSMGTASVAGDGSVSFTFAAPEDYGELHDLYVAIDGADAAKGGYRLQRTYTMTPTQGPVGTLITIKATGIGARAFESTAALRYDNKYTGFITATTTRGTAIAQIRAAGPVGKHLISVDGASHTLPYLNMQQSPVAFLVPFKAEFTVTADNGAPPAAIDWPDSNAVSTSSDVPRTTVRGATIAGASGSLSPDVGPILTETTLQASGLPPGSEADILWVTVAGNDLFGWNLSKEKLGQVTVGQDGTVSQSVKVPESLGGWHVISLERGEDVLVEVPFFVERSLIGVTPGRVRAGEKFSVQLKGVGWTEIDNGVAVVYDNAYIGYACGFASLGDVTIPMDATGGPGTHLIDLYPMIYDGGHGKWPWQYNMPQLTYARDHPSLQLGYRLPAFRLAIDVTP